EGEGMRGALLQYKGLRVWVADQMVSFLELEADFTHDLVYLGFKENLRVADDHGQVLVHFQHEHTLNAGPGDDQHIDDFKIQILFKRAVSGDQLKVLIDF